jgi:hypothetical protein
MPRHRTPAVFFLLLLAAVAAAVSGTPAAAKGVTGLSVCGADGCVARSAPPAALASLLDAGDSVADPGREPFVRLKMHVGDGGRTFGIVTVIYLPRAGLQRREDGTWGRPYPGAAALLDRLTRGVRTLPASALKPYVPTGPPVPEASSVSARAPLVQHAADTPGGGPSGLLVAAVAVAGAALAVALTAVALARRRRGGSARRPATG